MHAGRLGAKLKKKKRNMQEEIRGMKIAPNKKSQERGKEGRKGRGKKRQTESMICAGARRREWRWNNYKGGQSIRFPQRYTDASTG